MDGTKVQDDAFQCIIDTTMDQHMGRKLKAGKPYLVQKTSQRGWSKMWSFNLRLTANLYEVRALYKEIASVRRTRELKVKIAYLRC